MRKIVGIMRPFEYLQTLYVIEDGNKLEITQSTVEDLIPSLLVLAENYNTKQVSLLGPQQFSTGIKEKLLEEDKEFKVSFSL